MNRNSAIRFRHGYRSDQEIEVAEKLLETLRQYPISYSSAISVLDLTGKLLGDTVVVQQ